MACYIVICNNVWHVIFLFKHILVTQFNFYNLDSWPSRAAAAAEHSSCHRLSVTSGPAALAKSPAPTGSRGFHMGAWEGELGCVKALGCGPRGRLLVVSLVSRVCPHVGGMRVAVCEGCALPNNFPHPCRYANPCRPGLRAPADPATQARGEFGLQLAPFAIWNVKLFKPTLND